MHSDLIKKLPETLGFPEGKPTEKEMSKEERRRARPKTTGAGPTAPDLLREELQQADPHTRSQDKEKQKQVGAENTDYLPEAMMLPDDDDSDDEVSFNFNPTHEYQAQQVEAEEDSSSSSSDTNDGSESETEDEPAEAAAEEPAETSERVVTPRKTRSMGDATARRVEDLKKKKKKKKT